MNLPRQRSNSSAELRKQLQKNLASLPEISNKVALVSYINYCKKLHESARKAYDQADMRRCYVDLYKFQILALEKIPTHKDYKAKSTQTEKAKTWLKKATLSGMDWLEIVVYYLDREEDQRIIHLKEFSLIDEFDAIPERSPEEPIKPLIETSTSAPQHSVQSLSVLSMPSTTVESGSDLDAPSSLAYVVPDIVYAGESEEPEDSPAAPHGSTIAAILRCIGSYKRCVFNRYSVYDIFLHLILLPLHPAASPSRSHPPQSSTCRWEDGAMPFSKTIFSLLTLAFSPRCLRSCSCPGKPRRATGTVAHLLLSSLYDHSIISTPLWI